MIIIIIIIIVVIMIIDLPVQFQELKGHLDLHLLKVSILKEVPKYIQY